ncbi:hypothetical protein [Streptomyces griseoluteus]|uniref:hypothetical protein n=1 Tax=Streptomyces griseoluteus TaxID=29306 RepID=UPI00365923A8
MIATAGLLLALVCLAIVGAGLALVVTSWQPRPGHGPAATLAVAAGLCAAGLAVVLAAAHWLAHLLT